ncbi:class I SAM-dependent methyltransferase [Phenylobacterium sp.]|jgi:predicted methyltransferase|uniref:class I SAM-dependent methyltransferase n=1 Tax=Phenylobacterium sp. TaxID=1871053 RepID=UPI002E321133|nr:class I SAM-dependent methyltransferase [Phenylobacterium sp.]HEX2560600.1 class I SAM-dependent methyltransferase [Phenylobacterium sp.]
MKISVPALVLALAAAPAAFAQAVPAHISAALASPVRTDADKPRDAARKPGETLAFADIRPGDKVADFIIGGGYFTRILSAAVGPNGRVIAYQPEEFVAYQSSYGEALDAAAKLPNVTALRSSFAKLDLPDGLDAIVTVQNYHDLHLKHFPADTAKTVNAELFRSLKPGGVLLVVDHEAAAGSGLEVAHTLHRIDPAIVKRELEAAGFKLEAEDNQLLDQRSDPKTANVFDAAIRGKTDQFVLRFRKP